MTESPDSSNQPLTPQVGQAEANLSKTIGVAKQLCSYKKLKVVSSKFFARSIHANIQRIKDSRRPVRLRLRNNCSVVIIDNQTYEELSDIRAKLIEELRE
jgi:hypothetical protein